METAEKSKDRIWLAVLGIVLRMAYAIGVLVYVAFYTDTFSLFQKLAVLLVALIIYEAAKAIVHAAWPSSRRMRSGWW